MIRFHAFHLHINRAGCPLQESPAKVKERDRFGGQEGRILNCQLNMMCLSIGDKHAGFNIMWAEADLPYTLSWKRPLKSAIAVSHCRGQTAPATLRIFPPLYSFVYFWLLGLHCCAGFSAVVLSGGDSLLAAPELLSLRSLGSTAIAGHGLSRPEACGIFLDRRPNPCLLHWQADSSPLFLPPPFACISCQS